MAVCSTTLCSAATCLAVLEAALQVKPNPKLLHRHSNLRKKELFLINIQIRTYVRRSEDPSSGSPSRHRRFCSPRSDLLNVRGRWVLGNTTTVVWGDVRAAAGSADQGWGRLLLINVVDDPDKPSTLGCSDVRSQPLAHHRACSSPHRCCSMLTLANAT